MQLVNKIFKHEFVKNVFTLVIIKLSYKNNVYDIRLKKYFLL